jgi:hypothetical protein
VRFTAWGWTEEENQDALDDVIADIEQGAAE